MAQNQEYGGFWIRFLALLVDSTILFVLGAAIVIVGGVLGFAIGQAGLLIGMLAYVLVSILYWPVMHSSARQATFGKAMLGLKVTDYAGNRISFLRAFGRFLGTIISGAVFMLGYVVAAFTRRKQALHDLIASTLVVREGPAHVVGALAVAVAGFAAPLVLMLFVGGAMVAMFMGMMGGKQDAAKQQLPPQPAPPQVAKAKPPAAALVTKPAVPAQATTAPKPAASAGDIEAIFGAKLSGMEEPGMTRAGPAILELASLFGGSVSIETYLPPLKEFEGNSVSVVVNRVVDGKGGELYDPGHMLEKEFFQRVQLTGKSEPVPHLAGTRRVGLKSGANAKSVERVEGTLNLSVPLKPASASFGAADVGKPQTTHGVEMTLKEAKGKDVGFEFQGDHARVFSVSAFGADQKPLQQTGRRGGGLMGYSFSAPVARVEIVVAESYAQRAFPFTLTPTSLAGAPTPAAAAVAAPAAPPPPKVAAAQVQPPAAKTPQAAKGKEMEKAMEAMGKEMEKALKEAMQAAGKPAPAKPGPAAKPSKPAAVAAVKPAAEKPAVPKPVGPPDVAIPPSPSGPVITPKFNDLMTAVLYRDAAGVDELLKLGKWPDRPDSNGMTPLMAAVMLGDAVIAEALLKAGANPNLALSVARERRDGAMTGLLERHGAR